MAEHVAPRARVDIGLSGGLVGGDHCITNRGGDLADLSKERAAPRRYGALHGARIPQGVPFVIERSGDASFVAAVSEVAPPGVQGVGAPCDLRNHLLERLRAVIAPLIPRR